MQSKISEPKDVLTVQEMAEILRIGRNAAYALAASEEFPSIRVGRQFRISKSAFDDWLRRKPDHK